MKVYNEKCKNCLISPDAIVSPERRKNLLNEIAQKQSYFICHKASMRDEDICCSKWFQEFGSQSQLGRIAMRLGAVEFVDQTDQDKLPTWKEMNQ